LPGGQFTTIGGLTRNRLARINDNGTLDSTFTANADLDVFTVAVQGSGQILVGGQFSRINGVTRSGLARVGTTGTVDAGFNPNITNGSVFCVGVQADGKILVGGDFGTVGGTTRNFLVRLASSGTLETGFAPVLNSFLSAIALQTDGKILLAGGFTTINGVSRNRVARLTSTGALDSSFIANVTDRPFGMALQADGKVLVNGQFTTVSSTARFRLARLLNDSASENLSITASDRIQWLRGGSAPEAALVTFEHSSNGGASWSSLEPVSRTAGGWERTGIALPSAGRIRARAYLPGGGNNGSTGLVESVLVYTGLPQPEIAVEKPGGWTWQTKARSNSAAFRSGRV